MASEVKLGSKKARLFSIDLADNAADSLATAIDYYLDRKNPTWWKYTVMLTAHAVELYLKVRIAEVDYGLLFDKKNPDFSVGYDTAVQILKDNGVVLSASEISDIKAIRRMRNAIEHLETTIKAEALERYLARVLRFLDEFLKEELDTDIGTALSDIPERFREFKEAIYEAEEWLRLASEAASERMPSVRDLHKGARGEYAFCTECGNETVVVADHIDVPTCEYCRAEFPNCEYCDTCGTPVLDGIPEDDVGMCESCWEYRLDRD